MHVVYRVNLHREELPNCYIGSKSNCTFTDGKILDKNGNIYFGSSTYPRYSELCEEFGYDIEILFETDDYDSVISKESEIHTDLDVVSSKKYFNKSIAKKGYFASPNHISVRDTITGSYLRIPKDHVEFGERYVGTTKGSTLSEERKQQISIQMKGENNPFFGKKHSKETKDKISKLHRDLGSEVQNKRSDESKRRYIDAVSRPKSEEHKTKIGLRHKGLQMLQNISTLEIIKVKKDDPRLKSDEWVNPRKLKPESKFQCEHCSVVTTKSNLTRQHNDKCKHKKD